MRIGVGFKKVEGGEERMGRSGRVRGIKTKVKGGGRGGGNEQRITMRFHEGGWFAASC